MYWVRWYSDLAWDCSSPLAVLQYSLNCCHSCSCSILLINFLLCLCRQRPLEWTVLPLGGRRRTCCIIDVNLRKDGTFRYGHVCFGLTSWIAD